MSPRPGGAEEGVDDGVGQDVGVGVAGEPAVVGHVDAAEDEPPAGREAVAVPADAGRRRAHRERPSRPTSSGACAALGSATGRPASGAISSDARDGWSPSERRWTWRSVSTGAAS